MPKNQTIRFTDEAIAKVNAVAKAEDRKFNKVVNRACEALPDPEPVEKKAKKNGNKR